MTERNRQHLKQEFSDGERPSGDDFADLVDSFLNLTEDGVQVDAGNLVLSQGLGLADSSRATAGTLRFNGGRVQFHDGTNFVDLASGGGGAFQPVGGAGAVAYGGGNVGIGAALTATAPTFRLEVELGANNSEAQRVRFGNAACHNGAGAFQAFAHFSHRDHASNSAFAVRQGPTGEVHVNAPAGQAVSLRQNGNLVRLAVSTGGNVVVASPADLPAAGAAVLQVNGEAFKSAPGGAWQVPSDARLKEDVREFEAGLSELLQVRPVRFRFNGKAGTPAGSEGVGILGQEIERVFPEMVSRVPARLDDESPPVDLRVYDGSALTYVLVNAIKELAARLARLEEALADGGPADDDG